MTPRGVIYDTSWGGAKCQSPTQEMSDPGSNPGNYPEVVKRSTGTPHHLVKYHSSPLELAAQILGGVIYDTSWGGAKCQSPTQKISEPSSNPGNYPEGVKRSTGTPHHLVKYQSSPLELAAQILGGVIYDISRCHI